MEHPDRQDTTLPKGSMFNWPATPGKDRLMRTVRHAQEGGMPQEDEIITRADITDMEAALACTDSLRFTAWARDHIDRIQREMGWTLATAMILMNTIGRVADTRSTIGICVLEAEPDSIGIHFNRLSRNPDWAGFCVQWTRSQGMKAFIYESKKRPGQPGHIILVPPRYVRDQAMVHATVSGTVEREGENHFPQGMPALMSKIASWHGATGTTWHREDWRQDSNRPDRKEWEKTMTTETEDTGTRRSPGNLVWKVPGGGFIGEGCYVVIQQGLGHNIPCLICYAEECVEWNTATIVHADTLEQAREKVATGDFSGDVHHISECEMRDDRDPE